MENVGGESSSKDEKMKATFESSSEDDDSTPVKKRPSVFEAPPVETKKAEAAPEKPKINLFEALEVQEAKDDKEPPVDAIDAPETVAVADSYVEANLTDATQELADSEVGSVQEAAAAGSVAFIEALEERLETTDEVTPELLDEVTQEALETLQLETEDPEEAGETTPETTEADTPENPDDEPEESDPTLTPSTTPLQTPNNPIPPVAPPNPPNQPPPPVGPPNNPNQPANPQQPGTPNVVTPNLNVIVPPNLEFNRRRRRSGDILLGGIIGYMIGRRRGRIKAENRLLPIQDKLEKEVSDLHNEIAQRELQVRNRAIQERQKPTHAPEQLTQTITEIREQPTEPITKQEVKTEVVERETEKQVLVGEKVVMSKTVEAMSLPLVLQMASEIKLDGVSLKTMFEKGSIDQKNLRIVLKKYLQGEKLEKIWPKAMATEVVGESMAQAEKTEVLPASERSDFGRSRDPADEAPTVHARFTDSTNDTALEQSVIEDVQSIIEHKKAEKRPFPVLPAAAVAIVVVIAILIVLLILK